MIPASHGLAISALVTSGALHLAILSAFGPEEDVRMQGGAPASVARLGNSFQDVARGTQRPERPDELPAEEPVETAVTPLEAEPPLTPDRPERVEPEVRPSQAEAATSPRRAAAERTQTISADRSSPVAVARAAPEEAGTPEPDVVAALPRRASETAPLLSSRPKTRPQGLVPPRPKPTTKAAARQGGSEPEQVRGSTEGQPTAAQAQRSERQSDASAQAGNAAAANYPGEVQRQIFRQPRPSVTSRGTATVSFRIASNGGLASIGLIESSGSQALDAAAVQLVRRAAPFPAPPPGARVSFTIGIEGR